MQRITETVLTTIRVTVLLALLLTLPGALTAYEVPDTGQTKCYGGYSGSGTSEIPCPAPGEPLYGQDAQYGLNLRSFTKLDSSGNALPNNAVGHAMVRDNVTGLTWEVKQASDRSDNASNLHDADNKYTMAEALETFIAGLNAANYGGFDDWRLPNYKELFFLLDHEGTIKINTTYFPNTIFNKYWTSTPAADLSAPNCSWFVSFFAFKDTVNGYTGPLALTMIRPNSEDLYVRAVRGAEMPLVNDYVDNGDGTVTDMTTGLMWANRNYGGDSYFRDALSYAETLVLNNDGEWTRGTPNASGAKYDDFRLPNVNELMTLLDPTVATPWGDSSQLVPTLNPVFVLPASNYPTSTNVYSSGHWNYWYQIRFISMSVYSQLELTTPGMVHMPAKNGSFVNLAVRSPEPAECGNDIIEEGEWCDGEALEDNCTTAGYIGGGTLSCNSNCTLNTDLCLECGDESHCNDGDACTVDSCVDGDCVYDPIVCVDDGDFCNGFEECVDGTCQSSGAPCEGVVCDEVGDRCVECLVNADCGAIDLFCAGTFFCVDNSCQPSGNPCEGQFCDEDSDRCVECRVNADCAANGDFCDGIEGCVDGSCVSPGDPCGAQLCDEVGDRCVDCINDGHCDDGNPCTADTCVEDEGVVCMNEPITGCIACESDPDCPSGQECRDGVCSEVTTPPRTTTTTPPTGGGSGDGGEPGLSPADSLEVTGPVDLGSLLQRGSFEIRNPSGLGLLEWWIEPVEYISGSGWVSMVVPAEGETTYASQVFVIVNRSGLTPGRYEATIPVGSNAGTDSVQVLMTVDEADVPEPAPACDQDTDCDDGEFCNGAERCDNGVCAQRADPCGDDELCMEDEQTCWSVSNLTAQSVRNRFRRPRLLDERCIPLVLNVEGAGPLYLASARVVCTGPEGETQGVAPNPQREVRRLGDFVVVPLCIDQDASQGNWTVVLEMREGTEMQVLEAVIEIQ